MKQLSWRDLALAAVATVAVMAAAVAPALAMTRAGFDAARGRHEHADGRTLQLSGSARRPQAGGTAS